MREFVVASGSTHFGQFSDAWGRAGVAGLTVAHIFAYILYYTHDVDVLTRFVIIIEYALTNLIIIFNHQLLQLVANDQVINNQFV